jgi:hypothetical protein
VRLKLVLATVVLAVVLGQSAASALGLGGVLGGDQQASGELLGDGAAEVSARDGSDLGDPRRPRRGGGNVVCRYYDDATGEPVDFSSLPEDRDGIMLLRDCSDSETGEYVSIGLVPAGNRVGLRRLIWRGWHGPVCHCRCRRRG